MLASTFTCSGVVVAEFLGATPEAVIEDMGRV
jgi:hypothetical protein